MSLKRYAVLAAVSYHNSQKNEQPRKTTTTMKPEGILKNPSQHEIANATHTATTMPLSPPTTWSPLKTATKSVTATTTSNVITTTNLLDLNALSNNINNNNNADVFVTQQTSAEKLENLSTGAIGGAIVNVGIDSGPLPSNSITTYYGGGLGLFHQQNLRANAVGGSFLSANGNSGNGGGSGVSYPNTINGNVNLLLGGAMLSLVTTIFCVVCYCCHRNIKKRTEAAYRQQRQWLESDPNMEIYSVEQCYETSGLFLGDSTDGISSIPALHHEPPPSYDAVVAMQEQLLQQQQQQQFQQQQHSRTSPPPGYRSTLDVNTVAMHGGASALQSSRGTLDGMSSTNDSNADFNTVSASAATTVLHSNAYQQKPPAQQLMGLNPLLNMKKVLQAQSCCSLQRAEVENMWNAAAAAVAARNGATTSTAITTTHAPTSRAMMQPANSSSTASSTPTPAMLMIARKSLPTYSFGRHYRQQKSYYRRGCPLCGKFRYDTEDALSHCSNESGLDDSPVISGTTNGLDGCYRKVEEIEENPLVDNQGHSSEHFLNHSDASSLNVNANERDSSEWCENNNNIVDDIDINDVNECDECLCAGTAPNQSKQSLATTSFGTAKQLHENDYKNGNELSSSSSQSSTSLPQFFVDFNEPSNTDDNANMTAMFDNEPKSSTQTTEMASVSTATITTNSTIDLNSINENGIVRLDMSKIIDKTGLPTYDAALKLDSSGYV